MTTTTDFALNESTAGSPRPDWLPDHVWPHPLASLDVAGRRVVFTDTGGSGPVLLFVHVAQWSLLWGGVIAELRDQYRCVTLDAPGSGLSERVPRSEQNLTTAARAIGALIDHLDLRDITLVLHDLGGLAALAAVRHRVDRISGFAAVNTFGWRPRGLGLPVALRLFGSATMRELDAISGVLPWGSSTRFGVGRRMSRPTRRSWRAGLRDRSTRRSMHRLFLDAARNREIHADADASLEALADRPLLTVFGALGDYFRFQKQWRTRHSDLTQEVVPGGFHFPMCDNPALVARHLDNWHVSQIRGDGSQPAPRTTKA